MRKILCQSLIAAGLLAASSSTVLAQANRLTIVVPFAAGGGIDIFARLFGEEIGKSGQTVVIEDRPGASSMIGTEYVARAKPDGLTVLISSNSTLITPRLKKTAINPLTDLIPVCNLAESPQVIAVNKASPFKTLKELVAAAKEKPGNFTISSNGPASTQHLVAEMFKRSAQIDMTYVPYNGGAPAVNAVIGGQVTAVAGNYSEVHGQIDGGELRPLATTMSKRIPSAPNIPTAREEGFDFDIASWHGVAVPAKTPAAEVERVRDLFMTALKSPDLQKKLAVHQYLPTGVCGAQLVDVMKEQSDTIGRIAEIAGIKLD